MTVKSDVSGNYLQLQMETHGSKPINLPPQVIMTGDYKQGSIGSAIHNRLLPHVVSYSEDVTKTIHTEVFNGRDTLIMCHGATYLDWFEDAPLSEVRKIFDVNLFGSYNMAQAFVQATIGLPVRKRIIMIGSMAHRAVLNGSSAYCASKAGLAHLARCMAWELTPKGYDVYCIHPSNTAGTPMSIETIEGLCRYRNIIPSAAVAYWNDSPIRSEILSVDEIADLVWFLLHAKSGYLSGSQLELAGGQR